ncbi:MAG: LysR family transcriptional regulator [Rectinemataceae bacterium]
MELRHLRYFVAVARRGSFVKAAEALNISQPPLSRQIRELENEIGTELLDRSGKRSRMTLAGEYFLSAAESILEGLAASCRTAKIIGDSRTGDLKIGCVTFLLETVLLPLLGEFRENFPGTKLDIMSMSTEEQQRALRAGSIDVGIVGSWMDDPELDFSILIDECLSLVFPPGYCRGNDIAACMRRLSTLPFVTMSSAVAPGLRNWLEKVGGEYGHSLEAGLECNDASVIIKLVASGLGWSIVPIFMVPDADLGGVGTIELPQGISFGLCRRPAPLSSQGEAFCELALHHFGKVSKS